MPDNANPEREAVTDEESAVNMIQNLLEPKRPPAKESPEATREEEPEEEAAEEAAGEESPESSEENEQTEPDSEELPDTLPAFAEALGVDVGELADHLKVDVKVNGKVRSVTLAEAMKGYQLESDYRQKTADLAEQRRAIDAERQESLNRYQQQLQRLDQAIETAESLLAEQPNQEKLAELLESDPQEYLRQVSRIQTAQAKLQKARDEKAAALKEQTEKQTMQLVSFRKEQQGLLSEKMPELRNEEKLREFESGASSYLRDMGFSEQDISGFFNGPYDHRQVLIIRDAMKYRGMEKGKASLTKKLSSAPRVLRPGTAEKPNPEKEALQVSKERLRALGKKGKMARREQDKAAMEFVKARLS